MKKKNGFTLIELVVVIALIAILAVTLAPRLRDQIAKANDAKAIAVLGSLRTLSEIFYADFEETPVAHATADASIPGGLDVLIPDLDTSAIKLFQKAQNSTEDGSWAAADGYDVSIGGSRTTAKGDVSYGGQIGFTFTSPDSTSGDNVLIWFSTATAQDASSSGRAGDNFDVKGKRWASY